MTSGSPLDSLFRLTTSPGEPAAPGSRGGGPSGSGPINSGPTGGSPTSGIASAAPVRATGTRTRAGNAMNRTRAALLAGAAKAVATSGTRITMAQVATAGGVAKATLYNHFRTREAVLDALLEDQVGATIAAQADLPLRDALAGAALALSRNPVLAGLARVEPAVLARLGRVEAASDGWRRAHDAVSEALAAAGRGGAPTVVRWLSSFVLTPGTTAQIAADAAVLVAGLPLVAAPEQSAAPSAPGSLSA